MPEEEPTMENLQESGEQTKTVEERETEAPETSETHETETSQESETDLAEENRKLKARLAYSERQLRRTQKEIQIKETSSKDETKTEISGKPRQEDFDDFNDFNEALMDWKIENRNQQTKKEKAHIEFQQRAESFDVKLEKGFEKYKDFEIIFDPARLPIDQQMRPLIVDALHDSEHTADILYHLASNPDQAHKILSLSPIGIAREIGKLEVKFSGPNPPVQKSKTQAPAPTSPVGGNETPSKKLEDMSTEDFIESRNRQERGG